MNEFNWLNFCIPCKNWCCHNENPFASESELSQLKVTKINIKEDGSCIFLDKLGKCNVYEKRPFECHIFPFDIQVINEEIFWVLWNICPAAPHQSEKIIDSFEQKFSKRWDSNYIKQYVAYHKNNQPQKYSSNKFTIIRKLNWPTN